MYTECRIQQWAKYDVLLKAMLKETGWKVGHQKNVGGGKKHFVFQYQSMLPIRFIRVP